MIHFFLDTNIIYDFFTDRKPYSRQAAALFSAAERNKVRIYISAISFNNLYYVLRKDIGHKKALELLESLDAMVTTLDLNRMVIEKAIKSGYADFEDAIQYFCALSEQKIQAIITRNTKDFKSKDLLILKPEQAIRLIQGKG